MQANLHHIHLFASDLDASIAWWRDMLGGEVAFDGDFGGARNVFMRIGSGRLHLYEQQPRGSSGGAVHHVGIKCHGLPALVEQMKARGVAFRSEIREFGSWRTVPIDEALARPEDHVPEPGWEHALETVWENGKLVRDWTFAQVRERSEA